MELKDKRLRLISEIKFITTHLDGGTVAVRAILKDVKKIIDEELAQLDILDEAETAKVLGITADEQ